MSGGAGRGMAGLDELSPVPATTEVRWRVSSEGRLLIEDLSRSTWSLSYQPSIIQDLLSGDPARADAIVAALDACGERSGYVDVERVMIEIARVTAGPVAIVMGATHLRWRFDELLDRCGAFDVEGVVEAKEPFVSTWIRTEATPSIPWTREELTSPWVLPALFTLPEAGRLNPHRAGEPLLGAHVARLSDSGTGTMESLLGPSPQAITWHIRPDGRLEYATGELTYIAQRVARLETEDAVVVEVLERGVPRALWGSRARALDPSFILSEDRLRTPAGRYWRTLAGESEATRTSDGRPLGPVDTSGFRFIDDRVSERVSWLTGQDGQLTSQRSGRTYRTEDGRVRLTVTTDQSRAPCELGSAPDCYAARERQWWPVAFDRDRLYVVEVVRWDSFTLENRPIWDPQRQTYVDRDGNPVRRRLEPVVFPRLNAYVLDDFPGQL